jgi:ribosomal protein S4
MTKQEQSMFVRDLTASVLSDTLHDIRANRIPADWDGAELRQLLADRFDRAVYRRVLAGTRRRHYNAAILANDL